MTYEEALETNAELGNSYDDLARWTKERGLSSIVYKVPCADCGHSWGGHTRGDAGPCASTTECRCVGFLFPAEYGRLSPPRANLYAQIDGYWE